MNPIHGIRSKYTARNIRVAHPFLPKEVFAWDDWETGSVALAARINSQRAKQKSSPPMREM